ncbi:MAG: DUF805 domain-containing protein [Asticcacaulis sp.]|nr:DUF805 domain-containing protein [Asticcacaulis sp.]
MTWLPHVLAFLLFPAGRTGRRVFAAGLVGTIAGLFSFVLLWERIPPGDEGLRGISYLLPAMLVWTKSVLTARRLHDANLTGWLTLPGVMLIVNPVLVNFVLPSLHLPYDGNVPLMRNPYAVTFFATLLIALLGDLILCFIPGNQHANRFGQPPGRARQVDVAVF